MLARPHTVRATFNTSVIIMTIDELHSASKDACKRLEQLRGFL
ncbi:MAG: hypothetical protein ACI8W8_005117 [Rhodothermales bacterium]|jgi:hypothetical protein